MPCSYPSGDEPDNESLIRAFLCGIMTCLESEKNLNQVLDQLDYAEVGFTREALLTWWHKHVRQDRERRERAAREHEQQRLNKINALAKQLKNLDPEMKTMLKNALGEP